MKIAICTPCQADVTAEYAYSLAKLIARAGKTQIDFNGDIVLPTFELFMRQSSVLPQLRNILVRDALNWGANYLLWIDSDQKFPDDALLRLLSLNRPVVGTNYPRRVPPYLPTATALEGKLIAPLDGGGPADELVECLSMGLGFCLIDMTVFGRLHEHALANGQDGIWPLFAVEMTGDGSEIVGEDVYFFRKIRAAGIPVYVDRALSQHIGHVHQRALTLADISSPPKPAATPAAVKVRFDR